MNEPVAMDAGAPFERRDVLLPVAAPTRVVPRGFAQRLATGRPALLGGCLDRLELPTGSALARDLVCLGATRGVRPVFIDTETTGLGGVALPFMVGIAWYGEGNLTVTQWTLSRLGGESALLADVLATLRNLSPDPLVSFNGASFDLPLLRLRARRYGLCDRVLAAAHVDHVDLLHPARRIHGGFGPDCRLGTLERDLLGVRRRGDIDSAEIPEVFWRWLQAPGDPHALRQLQAVRDHNVVDLASLPALGAWLAGMIREPNDLERARRAARHFAKLGAHEQARRSLARWVEPGLTRAQQGQALASSWREAALELADLERRIGS
ncbi:ribonuclease H-like domain-containing protein, partial [Enhygromyxa salina]|uniref:ribonuclease H-like domain-containing protein n=1 Tax=Enhygromyxa salina TaxID=215803 RepID=UPI001969B0FD